MISKSMRKELESRGYHNISEDMLKDLDKLDTKTRTDLEFIMAKEEKENEINTISTRDMPIIVLDEDKGKQEKHTLAMQIKEGRSKEIYAFSKPYSSDKFEAMDEAYTFAKRKGMNVSKVKESVAEVIEQRQSDDVTLKDIITNAEFIEDEEYEEKQKESEDREMEMA